MNLRNNSTEINIYDFDHTIYNGDCSLDFYIFCIKKQPRLLLGFPLQIFRTIKFFIGLTSRTAFKTSFFSYLKKIKNVDSLVDKFWLTKEHKIKDIFNPLPENSVIISASPEFLLEPISKKLKSTRLIATKMDSNDGVINGKNCYGKEKIDRLNREFNNYIIVKAYSDSFSDKPIFNKAKKAYIVNGNNIVKLDDYKKRFRVNKIIFMNHQEN